MPRRNLSNILIQVTLIILFTSLFSRIYGSFTSLVSNPRTLMASSASTAAAVAAAAQEKQDPSVAAQQNKTIEEQVPRLPSLFISHGLVGETLDRKRSFHQYFTKYAQEHKLQERVKTVILVSAHWEESQFSINMNPTPKIIHDHPSQWLFKFNFRFETDLELAKQIKARMESKKFTVKTANEDVDHGGWGGLFMVFDMEKHQKVYDESKKSYAPKIVQVSLNSGMDPQLHYKLGQVLEEFRDESTMIICSGATTHSFTYMRHPEYVKWSENWENWLIGVVTDKDIAKRRQGLFNAKNEKMYPFINHSDDHFIPLLVALGTTSQPGELLWLEKNMILWGTSYNFP